MEIVASLGNSSVWYFVDDGKECTAVDSDHRWNIESSRILDSLVRYVDELTSMDRLDGMFVFAFRLSTVSRRWIHSGFEVFEDLRQETNVEFSSREVSFTRRTIDSTRRHRSREETRAFPHQSQRSATDLGFVRLVHSWWPWRASVEEGNCVLRTQEGWLKRPCSELQAFICEREINRQSIPLTVRCGNAPAPVLSMTHPTVPLSQPPTVAAVSPSIDEEDIVDAPAVPSIEPILSSTDRQEHQQQSTTTIESKSTSIDRSKKASLSLNNTRRCSSSSSRSSRCCSRWNRHDDLLCEHRRLLSV